MAIEANPFKNEYFFWLDAGASRFFQHIDASNPFPSPSGLNNIKSSGNRFIAQGRIDLATYQFDESQFIWTADNLIFGGMFGGKADIVIEIGTLLDQVFVEKMLDQGNVNNEQLALALIWNKNRDNFALCRDRQQQIALLAILGQQ